MDDGRQDLLALLMPVSRELRRIEDAAAAGHGLTMWQYAIVSIAAQRPGSNQAEIADALGYSKNRIVADIDELEAAGLLRRRPGADRRANVLVVTDEGERVMHAVRAEIHRDEDELLAPLSPTARKALVSALTRLRADLRPG
ncbi:MAG: MarR family transcriptional regulator [Ilumatobacteraceae bacterium]